MGALEHFVPVLGLFAGLVVAKLAPSELKQGQKYFKILQYALAIVVVVTAIWQKANAQQINLHIPIFLFFIPVGTIYHNKYKLLALIAAAYVIITLLLF